jgi:hypothetical protein
MNSPNPITLATITFGIGMGANYLSADETAKLEFFESRIRPVLINECYDCHSTESGKTKGGLLLDSRAAWQVGGESGPAILPGNPEESLVIKAISRSGIIPEMPPKSHLPKEVIQDFKKWIADGAVDPREGEAPVHEKETIDIEEGRKFWSFQPRQTFSGKHSIDGFVKPQAARAPADKLLRRLFLDLIGLPPTHDEREEFLSIYQKESPQKAVETFTDLLLNRKEFGEKWARHWLDVARYADSNGGDFNLTFHESWRYRNYVIDAFNEDMPYDQFLTEQIAGDLLPYDTPEQRNRQLIATGYLMVAPKMLTERDKPKMHLDIADEQLDTIGKSIMGLALGCARCHDHKFDPIPTADYYAMAGILHSTRTADKVLMDNVNVTGWTNTPLQLDAETQKTLEANKVKIAKLEKVLELKKKEAKAAQKRQLAIIVDDTEAETTGPWRKSTLRTNRIGAHYLASDIDNGPYSILWKATLPKPGKYEVRVTFGGGGGLAKTAPYVVRHAGGETNLTINQSVKPPIDGLWFALGQFEFGEDTTSSDSEGKVLAEVLLTDKNANGHVIADAVQFVQIEDLDKDLGDNPQLATEVREMEEQLKKLREAIPDSQEAMAAQDNPEAKRMGDLQIRIRGEVGNLGATVPRGFLQVASHENPEPITIPEGESGRVQLAQWLTRPDHPLTARVMTNRIWQQLFGQGIVATSDNFGMLGAKPSHPELLDYLSGEFVDNGWSMKFLIRKIVLSKTYQQEAKTYAADNPGNIQLRHQNRRPAPAETIRDSILAIAGELDPEPRESVVKPLGMYAIATSGNRHASLAKTGELRQRSIYMPIVRGAVPPSLSVFGLPNPDLVTGKRAATTVPAQALFMMNSPFVRDMAVAVSKSYSDEGQTIEEILHQLYQKILIRKADSEDIKMGKSYIQNLMENGNKSREEAVASFVQVLFSSTEFRFIE